LHGALTDGPVDEPAGVPCMGISGRALLPDLLGTSLHDPTWSGAFVLKRLQGHEKQCLAFCG